MTALFWVLCVLVGVVLLLSFLCYRLTFFRWREIEQEFPLPVGKAYEPFYEKMVEWMRETRQLPHEEWSVTSFDGLTLRGKYYEYAPGAPVELMFHGYRGTGERDLCSGAQRCFRLGHSALIIDQRAAGASEGKSITFGVLESRDCQTWLEYTVHRLGPDVRIVLTGISMGAATVLMAAGRPLPPNVMGVLADCGYTSARAIIHKVMKDARLPVAVLYPFVRLGAKWFGRFDLEEFSPIEAMERCAVPVIFFHGEGDDFVPCEMSRENFERCASPVKKLVTVPGAGHGLSYVVEGERYLKELSSFWEEAARSK